MHESRPPEQSDNSIREMLDARLQKLQHEEASRQALELASEAALREETARAEQERAIEAARQEQVRLEVARKAEAVRLEAIARAEAEAAKEAARLAEIAQQAENARLIELARLQEAERLAEAAALEEVVRLAAIEQLAAVKAEQAEALRLEEAAEEERRQAELIPPTLEHEITKKPVETTPSNSLEDETAQTTRKWPRRLAITTMAALTIAAGTTVATGHDRDIIDEARNQLGLASAEQNPPRLINPGLKLPMGFLQRDMTADKSIKKPKEGRAERSKKQRREDRKPEVKKTETAAPEPQTNSKSASPAPITGVVEAPQPKKKQAASASSSQSGGAKANETLPEGLTEEQADPSNYNTSEEPTGGATYGETPTNGGGAAAPYIASSTSN